MKIPLANYDMKNKKVKYDDSPDVIWAAILDNRYKIEVVRSSKSYNAEYTIYDSEANDSVIFHDEVVVAYNAVFGPDVSDVSSWQEKAIEIVDNR